ncbi:MAG: restriction endonuclease subunit S [Gemmatimonadetes bacterium]|nr:restriction endonuclease subunit S [Gemmatimonadota bacterium]MYD25238.1 restriction endonuclease subunit S [Gemmatimonadota bacterium]
MKYHLLHKRVGDICSVHSGYTARGRLQPATHSGSLAIQLGDFPQNGKIAPARLTRVEFKGQTDRFLVGQGDVLFRSRGDRNIAVALDGRFTERAVAVLPLYVLRPITDLIQPEYLAWIINLTPSQRYFDRVALKTTIRMVSRSSVESLEIKIPSLELQRKITTLDGLAEREHALTVLAADRRRDLNRLLLKGCIGDQIADNESGLIEER